MNDLIQNVVQSDVVIGFLNTVNAIVGGIDKLTESIGTLGTIGLGGGIFAGIKNIGQDKMWSCLIYAYPC